MITVYVFDKEQNLANFYGSNYKRRGKFRCNHLKLSLVSIHQMHSIKSIDIALYFSFMISVKLDESNNYHSLLFVHRHFFQIEVVFDLVSDNRLSLEIELSFYRHIKVTK